MISTKRLAMFAGPVLALVVMGQGCGSTTPAVGPDGGMFRTKDNGVTWTQLKTLNAGAKQGSIADVGIVTVGVDPQDPKAIYAGTELNGVIYSLDGGDSWQSAGGLNSGRVSSVAVDSKNKCIIYAAKDNQIFKTSNCSRDWSAIYYDPRSIKFTTLVVDWFNPSILYAGTSAGDVVKSVNGGATWSVSYRIDGYNVNQISLDKHDSRIVYVATDRAGIIKTVDAGATWVQIKKELSDFDGATRANLVVTDPATAGRVYSISKFGIIVSNDNGATWTALKLPTPAGSVDMKAFAVSPKNSKSLVYATDKAVVWSEDGGATWTLKKLPTSRGAAILIYDSSADKPALFLGALPPKK